MKKTLASILFLLILAASPLFGQTTNYPYTNLGVVGNVYVGGVIYGAGIGTGTTPVATFYLDGTRADSYTENGSISYPFKSLTTLLPAVSALTEPFVINCTPTSTPYTYTGNISFPAYAATINGNGCAVTVTGNITLNGPTTLFNFTTTATNVTYAYTGAVQSARIGGALNTNLTIQGGSPQFISVQAAGTITITGGQPYFNGLTGTALVTQNGASSVAVFINTELSTASATANLTNQSGQMIISGALLTNGGGTANVAFTNTNTAGTPNLLNGVDMNYGLSAGAAYTYISPDSITPNVSGSNVNTSAAVYNGGTGATTAAGARTNLGVPGISGTPTAGHGVCWKTSGQLGDCTSGTWPNCSTCN